jgi:hypothetical protein
MLFIFSSESDRKRSTKSNSISDINLESFDEYRIAFLRMSISILVCNQSLNKYRLTMNTMIVVISFDIIRQDSLEICTIDIELCFYN